MCDSVYFIKCKKQTVFSKIYPLFSLKGEMKVSIAEDCIQRPLTHTHTLKSELAAKGRASLVRPKLGGRIEAVW